ncbi:hypothetical protein AXF42_Ash002818 [Apostasia shenzhenica]|uniref:Uncharacterized protein n=1 Tax=Apostasia shenzhenica TaxID=1088818 RepID=A0A2I0A7D3_9ASPA|nr:hypothetical protein AXF42_Ash002818 [Apostasia shenzhenica]
MATSGHLLPFLLLLLSTAAGAAAASDSSWEVIADAYDNSFVQIVGDLAVTYNALIKGLSFCRTVQASSLRSPGSDVVRYRVGLFATNPGAPAKRLSFMATADVVGSTISGGSVVVKSFKILGFVHSLLPYDGSKVTCYFN